jgi:hypothetical protein
VTLPAAQALEAFRAYPDWDDARREDELGRLIAAHPPAELRAAVRSRLDDLGEKLGEPLLRLVEVLATPELLEALAVAVLAQPDLAPERAWEALALLDDAGRLDDSPELAERWEELNETVEDDKSLDQLARQIEDEPDGLWLALQGLSAVEPDVRADIVAGLAPLLRSPRSNLIEFFRLLCYAHDPVTRASALDALTATTSGRDDVDRAALWSSIAADHGDPSVVRRARLQLGGGREEGGTLVRVGSTGTAPGIARASRSLVTPVDGAGRGTVVLSVGEGDRYTSAAFLCDVREGVREVIGQSATDRTTAGLFLDEFAAEMGPGIVRDAPWIAVGLLEGCLLLCGPGAPPALRFWVEQTLGPGITGRPFPIPFPDWDPASILPGQMAERAWLVLEACQDWVDDSQLTHDLAEEILLREGDLPPEPRRDAGVFRYLFEHRLRGRLELYRRMLLWMSSFWQAAGELELGHSALALASQLGDEQHAVPGHPFTVALSIRSLSVAQANLRAGIRPNADRNPAGRRP